MRQTIIIPAAFLCFGLLSSNVLAEIDVTPEAPAAPASTQTQPASQPAPASTEQETTPAAVDNTADATSTDEPDSAKDQNDPREKIKNAVVKVYIVQHIYQTLSPWNSDAQRGSGSGLIIDGNLILTNAHVAADTSFLEVQRHGETERHQAEVVYISHESDLALLRTKDPDVYKDIPPLQLGDLPKMQQPVEVYGFPVGGNTLSVTRGVVSRIEKQNYVHTGENLMAVQVDAAINFGNSGGPVISDGKVIGVAMQSSMLTENIGYMIPTPIIRHVLDDVKDGKVDGYGFHGFLTQSLENPGMRHKYGLNDKQTGMLVHKVYKNSPADGKIEVGDIMTEIDGHKIENNGTVEFRPGEFIDHTHYIDLHQIGEDVTFKLIRKGQPLEVSLRLDKPGKEYLLVKPNQYDKQPSYFIFGGYVFMPLNQDVIDAIDSPPARLVSLSYESPDKDRQEAVIMTKVLPADINKDHHDDSDLLIEKVNGEPILNFRDFVQKMESSTEPFITLDSSDDYQIVIDNKEAKDRQPAILKQYGITADRSKDLLQTSETRTAETSANPTEEKAANTTPAVTDTAATPEQNGTGKPSGQ
jgi:S1-C subfamily serine protease